MGTERVRKAHIQILVKLLHISITEQILLCIQLSIIANTCWVWFGKYVFVWMMFVTLAELCIR